MKMNKVMMFGLAMILLVAIAPAYSEYYETYTPGEKLVEKVTHLHFFLHDFLSGKNPGAVIIARANSTSPSEKSPAPFGSLVAIDDPLREGRETTSKIIGNAQGLYLSSTQDPSHFTIVMYVDFAFTTGAFNGSSFSLFSRNPIWQGDNREVAIVGGRGKFRMARGFANIKTAYFNGTTGDAILQFSVTLYHY